MHRPWKPPPGLPPAWGLQRWHSPSQANFASVQRWWHAQAGSPSSVHCAMCVWCCSPPAEPIPFHFLPQPTFAVLSMEPVAMVVLWGLKDRHTISVSWPAGRRRGHGWSGLNWAWRTRTCRGVLGHVRAGVRPLCRGLLGVGALSCEGLGLDWVGGWGPFSCGLMDIMRTRGRMSLLAS